MTTYDPAVNAGPYWYLATPYSKYSGGLEMAFQEACRARAHLLRQGVRTFSPIVHSHPVAMYGGLDPLDHTIWLPDNQPILDAAHGLMVVQMTGWADSYGIGEEIKIFQAVGKPIQYVAWDDEERAIAEGRDG